MPKGEQFEPVPHYEISSDWQASGLCAHHITPNERDNYLAMIEEQCIGNPIFTPAVLRAIRKEIIWKTDDHNDLEAKLIKSKEIKKLQQLNQQSNSQLPKELQAEHSY